MNRLPPAPTLNNIHSKVPQVNGWLKEVEGRLNVYSGTANPVTIPENQWIIYNNTSLSEVRIWTNIAGVLLKSAAFT